MSSGSKVEVLRLLKKLRDVPVNTEEMDVKELSTIYGYLMNVPSSSNGVLHWFCSRVDDDVIEAATFCIRMFAYASVPMWRQKLAECMAHCPQCVQGLERAKVTSRTTYFGAYKDEILTSFYNTMETWELSTVLENLTTAGLINGNEFSQRTLADVNSAVVYRMVSNWAVFSDSRIQSLITTQPPPETLPQWPKDPLPPGMLLLLIHDKVEVRRWAEAQASQSTVVPIDEISFAGVYLQAIEVIGRHLTDSSLNAGLSFPFVADPSDLWSGFKKILRYIPVNVLVSPSRSYSGFRGIVAKHLHDTGPQFTHILHCFLFLLKRMGSKFWTGEGPEYSKVVFDSVKDNRTFCELLQTVHSSKDQAWCLAWFSEFLHTIVDAHAYREVLAKVVDFLCEEAQHERFQDARPTIMLAGIRLLSSAMAKSASEANLVYRHALYATLDIHGETCLAVAFASSYDTEAWQLARTTARDFILNVLQSDITDVVSTIHNVTAILARNSRPGETQKSAEFRTLSIRNSTWKMLYLSIQTTDIDGITRLISLVAQTSHIDTLNLTIFSKISSTRSIDGTQTAGAALSEVNRALGVFRDGFLTSMTSFADYNTSSAALDLLQRPGVVKNLIKIILSPIEDLQVAAQVIVGLAFDADARQECLRALLENVPGEAVDGILDFLITFKDYAPVMPEACNLSKSLVRCFSDILDVLSATPNGLLHSARFLDPDNPKGPAANLMSMWKLMTKSFTVILKRTPLWATFFENREMVVWMRDALIFGRDVLATWRVIEKAANSREPAAVRDSGKLSRLGKEMASGLQEVLFELTRWMRLTDEELLHQSFALLTSLLSCFRDAGLSPLDETIQRLRKFIQSARKSEANSRLDRTRLLALEAALDEFEDVVEIVSPPPALRASTKVKEPQVSTKDKANEQRYIMTSKSKTAPSLSARSSSTSMKSQYFTERDRKIETKPSKPTVSTKPLPGSTRSSVKVPKFEGHTSTLKPESSSSESESASDDEEQNSGLARLAKLQRTPKVKKHMERRQVIKMDIPIEKNVMRERLARRDEIRNAAIRLNPNIGDFYRTVLSWDYQHSGSAPPGPKPRYTPIPDTFSNCDDYRRIWEPLLMSDVWASIQKSKQEDLDNFDVKVNSRQFSDQWLDVDISFTGSLKKDWYLTDTDLVVLKHQNSSKLVMAQTLSFRTIPFGPQQGTQASVRCLAKNDPGLQMNTLWQLSKVLDLKTAQREYASLVAVPYYDHVQTILNPQLPNLAELKDKDIHEVMTTYRVNEPQAKAILSSLRSNGFVLIQGPPGTGKTSTICSLIAASLSAKKPQIVLGARDGPSTQAPTKILLCAPSNAAIDEIASRLHSGSFGGKPPGSIKVVRIGAKYSMNASVLEISLDSLVEAKLAKDAASTGKPLEASSEVASLQHEIEALKQLKIQKEQEKENTRDNAARRQALMDEISQLRSRQTALVRELDRRRDQNKSRMRDIEAKRRTFKMDVLQECDVVCTTLSGAANDLLGRFDFEMVVIDEAAQCVELSSLIPLKYRSNRCVMVGDPQQLPPTVMSTEACRFNYNRSLFVRLQKHRPEAVHLLSIQYRMHPEISRLPSAIFYQGRLLDGPDMDVKTKQPWHSNPKFGTYRFFNVKGTEELDSRRSLKNVTEIQVAVALYGRLVQEYSSINFNYRIGIVSMYRAQIVEIRKAFSARFGSQVLDTVDFNTVDGFQGQEKDIIILSCVRSGVGIQNIGFLDDHRRMNVALTRAKSSLFILGNAPTLERSDETWKNIVANARERSSLLNTDPSFFTTSSTTYSVPPPPTPTKVPKAVPSVPLPPDLMTPREFKAAQQVAGPSKSVQPGPSSTDTTQLNGDLMTPRDFKAAQQVAELSEASPHSGNVMQASGPLSSNNSNEPPQVTASSLNRKRPVEDDDHRKQLDPGSSKTRPPPAKRPKQTTMFIPKKKR
ncbi:hypothetical protein H0H92_002547 [Tricholoma furcatifolium]|nr:hypothetical protein H0H92_002547 [Tricholoma furcatifolium]